MATMADPDQNEWALANLVLAGGTLAATQPQISYARNNSLSRIWNLRYPQ